MLLFSHVCQSLQKRAACVAEVSLFMSCFWLPVKKGKTFLKIHSYCWHASSLVDKPSQTKKPCRVPPVMFPRWEGNPSLVPPSQGHFVWMLSPQAMQQTCPCSFLLTFSPSTCYIFTIELWYKYNIANYIIVYSLKKDKRLLSGWDFVCFAIVVILVFDNQG